MRQSLTENARIIDNMKTKIIEYEEREKGISRSYEERIRNIQSEMVLKDNLKRSQLSSTEEKVVMTSQ